MDFLNKFNKDQNLLMTQTDCPDSFFVQSNALINPQVNVGSLAEMGANA